MGFKSRLRKRDDAVVAVCNWLLRHFTSEEYYAWYCAMLVRGREVLELDLDELTKDEE